MLNRVSPVITRAVLRMFHLASNRVLRVHQRPEVQILPGPHDRNPSKAKQPAS
jgi:hypothetical protein